MNDKVTCIDSTNTTRLIEGKEYPLIGVLECNCGLSYFDVGVEIPDSNWHKCLCGQAHFSHKKAWYRSTRFVKADTNQQLENEIHEAMKGTPITSH